ncbi:hypothetical protein ACVWZV_000121 [Bradyrhizobium sp. GM5.1]|uniref:hypothetical protein n=1 Tax=Bradyrhizobium sp. 169 TaxID=2782640 RepID=UPI001FF98EF9|nr:hypothetical protein [Bradyrhizobium sp. 169]MCK1589111.1 hypothetical protein [Bradyrhizobium sp. 169]
MGIEDFNWAQLVLERPPSLTSQYNGHMFPQEEDDVSVLKIASARRQLGSALSIYLQDLDPVSVHCLAGGGCELIEYYAKKAGGEPFTSHVLKTFPDMDIRQVRILQRKFWNAFKHATHQYSGEERDDDELLMRFTDGAERSRLIHRLVRLRTCYKHNADRGTGTSGLVHRPASRQIGSAFSARTS